MMLTYNEAIVAMFILVSIVCTIVVIRKGGPK